MEQSQPQKPADVQPTEETAESSKNSGDEVGESDSEIIQPEIESIFVTQKTVKMKEEDKVENLEDHSDDSSSDSDTKQSDDERRVLVDDDEIEDQRQVSQTEETYDVKVDQDSTHGEEDVQEAIEEPVTSKVPQAEAPKDILKNQDDKQAEEQLQEPLKNTWGKAGSKKPAQVQEASKPEQVDLKPLKKPVII